MPIAHTMLFYWTFSHPGPRIQGSVLRAIDGFNA